MDAFQVRMDFQALLKRLNASQQSIEKVLSFADRHVGRASADLWDCILNECGKTNLSSRLNLLFLLDFLFTDYSSRYSQRLINDFRCLASKDLLRLVDQVVPQDSLNGVKLNSGVTIQLLSSWRLKRLFPQDQITSILTSLQERIADILQSRNTGGKREDEAGWSTLSHAELLRRIEEDRERHKRIREKLWVLPPKSYFDAVPEPVSSSRHPQQRQGESERAAKRPKLASTSVDAGEEEQEDGHEGPLPHMDPLDIQFEDLWETTSDLNQDDLDAWKDEEEERWWGSDEQIRRREAERLVELNQQKELETERKRRAFEFEQEQERGKQGQQDEVMRDDTATGDPSRSGLKPRDQHPPHPRNAGVAADPMGPPPSKSLTSAFEAPSGPSSTLSRDESSSAHQGPPPRRTHSFAWPPHQQSPNRPQPPHHYHQRGQASHSHSNFGSGASDYHQPAASAAPSIARWGSRGPQHHAQGGPPVTHPRRWGSDATSR